MLDKRNSVIHKLLASPFFADLPLSHTKKLRKYFAKNQVEMSISSKKSRRPPRKADYFAGRAGDDPLNQSRKIQSIVSTVKVPIYERPEDHWISVDALILLGCVRCCGYNSEKAQVFHRVVAPQQYDVVSITDTDLSDALRFMISTSTILEEMERDFVEHPNRTVNYERY